METRYEQFKCINPINIDRFNLEKGKIYLIDPQSQMLKLFPDITVFLSKKEFQSFIRVREKG